jgi:hypothetical protein
MEPEREVQWSPCVRVRVRVRVMVRVRVRVRVRALLSDIQEVCVY